MIEIENFINRLIARGAQGVALQVKKGEILRIGGSGRGKPSCQAHSAVSGDRGHTGDGISFPRPEG